MESCRSKGKSLLQGSKKIPGNTGCTARAGVSLSAFRDRAFAFEYDTGARENPARFYCFGPAVSQASYSVLLGRYAFGALKRLKKAETVGIPGVFHDFLPAVSFVSFRSVFAFQYAAGGYNRKAIRYKNP